MLTFDKEKHEYRWNGVVVPSVTQILKDNNISFDFERNVPSQILERSILFGNAVHLAINYHENGILDEDNLDEPLKNCLRQWVLFKEQYGVSVIESEHQGYCSLGFGFTIDIIAKVEKLKNEQAIIDIKTGPAGAAVEIQTAGYVLGMENKIKHRMSVEIAQTAYKPRILTDKNAQSVFLSALNLTNYRRNQ